MKLLYIGNKLTRHGINATTVETLGKALQEEGYEVVSVSDKKNFFHRILEMAVACAFQKNVDYVLIDTYSTKAFWYAFLCSQICRIRNIHYIPVLHGGNLPERLKRNPRLTRMIFAHAYKNSAPSGYLKSVFESHGYTNVVFIPNSIAIEQYPFKRREQFKPDLLWVRAFAEIYNPEMAVYVLQKIAETYPEASLTMVGPDKENFLEEVKQLADKLKLNVTFTGKLAKEEWWKLSESFDFFINTTHFDNTPVSVMEAMALGIPVISTNVGGLPFLLEDKKDAILVSDGSVEEMASAILELIQNPLKAKQLVYEARDKAGQWDWEEVKTLWKELFLG
ncbi:glycosyltransferase family 4 protein [Flavobacterium sp. NRK F10]|uniref:glycosyltransferase family 4 protein n=1 Tax=Flavobacterium sp. NRK F10 TaxID=2954931 RepID=UPI0020908C7E|nr:glycosyltransferase family 4 protein [Flavobacterium sp. NRK F10]MCO6174162.1 glycosyltransferase family 4 protein [Flavobacterium sp. NRK F10]